MTVYLDLYFIVNLLMDFLLLSAVGSRFRPRRGRRLLASLFGGLCACGTLLLNMPDWQQLLLSLPVASLMLLIAHPPVSWEAFGRDLFYLLCCSLFLSGLLPFLLLYFKLWIFCVALSYLILRAFLYFMGRNRRQVILEIGVQDSLWKIPALVDSGNTLREPISGLPIIVVRQSCLPGHPAGSYPVPYHTVGAQGLLLAFRPDRLWIDGEQVREALVAPSPDFSESTACQALVPEALQALPFTLL